MARDRHSYIAFYPSDWIAGTARMTPMQELVYFRVCVFNWDKGVPVPPGELPLMLGTVPDWRVVLLDLAHAGKLVETPDGSVANTRAVSAAREANDLWTKKSKGGKTGAAKTNAPKTPDATPAVSAVETPAATPDETPAASDDATGPGLPSHNLNHNQNHNQPVVEAAQPSAALPAIFDALKSDDEVSDATPPALASKRGTRLPAEWQPSVEDVAFCEIHRPDLEAGEIADSFRDWWISAAGQKGVKLDWHATWRNWVRNQKPGQRKNGQSRTMQALDNIAREYRT